jgi:hypothetical protein
VPQIDDMRSPALLPLRRKACWGFFRPENPTSSAGFEPTNLGTRGRHASSRPPKPLTLLIAHNKLQIFCIPVIVRYSTSYSNLNQSSKSVPSENNIYDMFSTGTRPGYKTVTGPLKRPVSLQLQTALFFKLPNL